MSKAGNGFTRRTFELFEELGANNNTAWFREHKEEFDEYVIQPFGRFLEAVSEHLIDGPLHLRGGPDTMFRMVRDHRFSKDKRSYHESISGLLTTDGTKNGPGPRAYLHISGTGANIGGGIWQPTAAELRPVRQRIVHDPRSFQTVLDALAGADMAFDQARAVKTMPHGFAENADHPHAATIRLTQMTALRPIPKESWIDDTAADGVLEAIDALAVFYDFIDAANDEAH